MEYNNIKIAVLGGDLRMLVCARELSADGFEVSFFGFDSCESDCGSAVRCRSVQDASAGASVVILPVPYSTDGCRLNCPFSRLEARLPQLLETLDSGQLILAGMCPDAFIEKAQEHRITVVDYMKDEELAVRNAVPTAEGALELAMRELPVTVHGCRVLIIGFGRVGMCTAAVFSALHARVTVAARRADALAWAEVRGYEGADISLLPQLAANAELIINTVPETVLNAAALRGVSKAALIIDLSSAPGGVDLDYAAQAELKVVRAMSLPGKVAPVTSGINIKNAVISLLKRRGII